MQTTAQKLTAFGNLGLVQVRVEQGTDTGQLIHDAIFAKQA
jgi:hypothetical protein